MFAFTLPALIAWIQLGQQVFDGGTELWGKIHTLLQDNGIEADNQALLAGIADAQRRKAQAQADAQG